MKLIGNYLSPYVRRVAVSLNVLGFDYVLDERFVFKSPEAVRPYNPLVRIPTLVLDDGEAIVESYAILDALDDMVALERRLVPSDGRTRRHVMKLAAIGLGCMEKAQWAFYEGRFRPAEKVHAPWVEHNEAQVVGGLGYLEGFAARAGEKGWLAATPDISQADITAATAVSFVRAVRPHLEIDAVAPCLARFTARCERREAFAGVPIPRQ